MQAVEIDVLASVAGGGENWIQLRGGRPNVIYEVWSGGGVAAAVSDESDWESISVPVWSTVACYTGNESISHTIRRNNARYSTHKDQILGGARIVADGLDVDQLPASVAGSNWILQRGGTVWDIIDEGRWLGEMGEMGESGQQEKNEHFVSEHECYMGYE